MRYRRNERQRRIEFDALEMRVVAAVGLPHASALVAHVDSAVQSIPGLFKGTLVNHTFEIVSTNLSGKVDKVAFSGLFTGTIFGKQFAGGMLHLANTKGTIDVEMFPSQIVTKGSQSSVGAQTVITQATGAYAVVAGLGGKASIQWNSGPSFHEGTREGFKLGLSWETQSLTPEERTIVLQILSGRRAGF
jgi:hypothetical protein